MFVKNIDNVVPDRLRGATLKYKKVIAGYLIELHDRITNYINMIDSRSYTDGQLEEVCGFLRDAFSFDAPELTALKGEDLATYLRVKLDRPLRVCGMVKNEGEPGGGPEADGVVPGVAAAELALGDHQADGQAVVHVVEVAVDPGHHPVPLFLQGLGGVGDGAPVREDAAVGDDGGHGPVGDVCNQVLRPVIGADGAPEDVGGELGLLIEEHVRGGEVVPHGLGGQGGGNRQRRQQGETQQQGQRSGKDSFHRVPPYLSGVVERLSSYHKPEGK